METESSKDTAESVITVKASDLPLSCPMPDAPVWNMHPKVYLAIKDTPDGRTKCPYCGTVYQLED